MAMQIWIGFFFFFKLENFVLSSAHDIRMERVRICDRVPKYAVDFDDIDINDFWNYLWVLIQITGRRSEVSSRWYCWATGLDMLLYKMQ